MADDHFIASVDIGSHKIVVLLAEENEGRLEIFGYARGDSAGVRKGVITNVDQAAKAIEKVKKEAVSKCKTKFSSVNINISDPNLVIFNQHPEVVVLTDKVTKENIEYVIEAAHSKVALANQHVLHSVVHNYILDKNPTTLQGVVIKNPIGQKANNLEANIHTVVTSDQCVKDIENSVCQGELGVSNIVPSSMASSEPYLTQEQKEQGVCVVDIGAEVIDLSVFKDGNIFYSTALQVGVEQVNEDISYAFNVDSKEAERLKKKYGQAQVKALTKDKLIKFQQEDDSKERYLSHQSLVKVIEESYLELFSLIRKKLNNEKLYRSLKAGFILTGGGAKIKDCDKLMFSCFKKRAKVGRVNTDLICIKPTLNFLDDDLLTPEYACALGLLLFDPDDIEFKQKQSNNKKRMFGKMRQKIGGRF
ncbi:Cell division protein FtsA [uncultured Candidatus Thioglobus sp.]|nr:Cell division protein FtsA [uncultured Candidatus Thioglobus sp.]